MSRQPGDMRSRPPDRQNGAPGSSGPDRSWRWALMVLLGVVVLAVPGVQRDVPAVKPDGQLQPVPERARAWRSDEGPSEQQYRGDHFHRAQWRELRHPGPAAVVTTPKSSPLSASTSLPARAFRSRRRARASWSACYPTSSLAY